MTDIASATTGTSGSENSSDVGDRRGISWRTSLVRLAAFLGIVLFIVVVVLADIFYSFDDSAVRWLFISIGHLLIAPLAFLASLRLGLLITIALYVAAVVLALDVLQVVIRAINFEQTIQSILLMAANITLIGVSVLYLSSLTYLRKVDYELNSASTGTDGKGKRAAMIRQESNALRAIAVFALIGLVVTLLTLAVFDLYGTSLGLYTLLYLGHVLLAALAFLAVPAGGVWPTLFLGVATLQAGLDLLQFVLRVLESPGASLEILTLENIANTVLLVINAAYIVIDVAYVSTGFSLLAATSYAEDSDLEEAERTDERVKKLQKKSATEAIRYQVDDSDMRAAAFARNQAADESLSGATGLKPASGIMSKTGEETSVRQRRAR